VGAGWHHLTLKGAELAAILGYRPLPQPARSPRRPAALPQALQARRHGGGGWAVPQVRLSICRV
jgi:hypothetical protein